MRKLDDIQGFIITGHNLRNIMQVDDPLLMTGIIRILKKIFKKYKNKKLSIHRKDRMHGRQLKRQSAL